MNLIQLGLREKLSWHVSDSDKAPQLSIIVATHNRPDDVRLCLDALRGQERLSECEVIVVDSASDPEHAEALEAFVEASGIAQFHRLDTPGVSLARNHGARLAKAPWFATLDDDAVAEPRWIDGALELIGRVDDTVGIIQGRVNPAWPCSPPPPLGPLWRDYLSIVQKEHDHDMTQGHCCAGANMMVRKAAWEKIGGYNENVGRKGKVLISGIDTDLAEKIVRSGHRILYSNLIAVDHKIHAERVNRSWIIKRAYMEGKAQAATLPRSSFSTVALTGKLLAAIPVLEVMTRLKPAEDDLLVRRHLDAGLLVGILPRFRFPSSTNSH